MEPEKTANPEDVQELTLVPPPFDPKTFGTTPPEGAPPLTEADVCRIIQPLVDEIRALRKDTDAMRGDIQTLSTDTYRRSYIDKKVVERDQQIAELEKRQNLHMETMLNGIGKRLEDTMRGLTDQVKTTQVRYGEVVKLNQDTATLAQKGIELANQALSAIGTVAQSVQNWQPLHEAVNIRAAAAENKVDKLERKVENIDAIQISSEERLVKLVAVWEGTSEDVRKHEIEIDTLQGHYQTVAISSATSAAAVTQLQTTFSPRNVISAMIVFATMIGLDSGALQRAIETFSKLFGG